MPTTHLDEIRKKRPLSRNARAHVDVLKRLMELEVSLTQLREARGVTQTSIAEQLATSRPNISRIERESDLHVSTLSRYIEALGGQMEVRAVFPDAAVTLISAGSLSEGPRAVVGSFKLAKAATAGARTRKTTAKRASGTASTGRAAAKKSVRQDAPTKQNTSSTRSTGSTRKAKERSSRRSASG
jgi:transcriptional regulator with XRE-family HTH domain